MKHGFYCSMYGKDCFLETDQTNRTMKLASDFINKVREKENKFTNDGEDTILAEETIKYIQNAMRPATFEIKTIKNGKFAGLSYYTIEGNEFSYGCDACQNPLNKCVIV